MPDTRGAPSSTNRYWKRRYDPRAMAAARRVASEIGMPTDPVAPSVILRVVEGDPLLSPFDPTLRRLGFLDSLNLQRGCEEIETYIPMEAMALIQRKAALVISAWKHLELDPVKYYQALLIDLYNQ